MFEVQVQIEIELQRVDLSDRSSQSILLLKNMTRRMTRYCDYDGAWLGKVAMMKGIIYIVCHLGHEYGVVPPIATNHKVVITKIKNEVCMYSNYFLLAFIIQKNLLSCACAPLMQLYPSALSLALWSLISRFSR